MIAIVADFSEIRSSEAFHRSLDFAKAHVFRPSSIRCQASHTWPTAEARISSIWTSASDPTKR